MTKSRSPQHCNGNMLCALAIKTTGKDPTIHEIIQLSILPLYADLTINKELIPFNIFFKPARYEARDPHCHNLLRVAMDIGYEPHLALDIFDTWYKSLDLPYKKYGQERCQVMLIVHDYPITKAFLETLLGIEVLEECFHPSVRDLMSVGLFKNDLASFSAEKIPFAKVLLRYMAGKLGVEAESSRDALEDCKALAESYRRLCLGRI